MAPPEVIILIARLRPPQQMAPCDLGSARRKGHAMAPGGSVEFQRNHFFI